jgi:hypothetical protein
LRGLSALAWEWRITDVKWSEAERDSRKIKSRRAK